MGDFLLDLRPQNRLPTARAEALLRRHSNGRFHTITTPSFSLTISDSADDTIWAPYVPQQGPLVVAVAGRIAVPDADLDKARAMPDPGGLVCKAIHRLVTESGPHAVRSLGGNYVLFLWNTREKCLTVFTDCTGVFPAYATQTGPFHVLGSHPDSLAEATDNQHILDEVSLAEFLITGTVSPPFTYYTNIRAVGRAMMLIFDSDHQQTSTLRTTECYLPLSFRGSTLDKEDDVAEEFAEVFRTSVALRSRPILGRCAVALSGGLDSRAVLSSLHPDADAFAFTCYDAPNLELRTAQHIAAALGVSFQKFQRPFEYYGSHAADGVRISGGMGSFANNHFLGVLPLLVDGGAKTFLTGCYCDYLFKGLPLNRRTDRLTGREELAPFDPEFYFSHVWPDTPLSTAVRARIHARYPESIRSSNDFDSILQLEAIRTFPLCYEGDNAQRLVPQRLTGWFPPVSHPALMDLYCRIPYPWKLNRSIFKKAVRILTGRHFHGIPDANTGASVEAPPWSIAAHSLLLYLKRRLRLFKRGLATEGSWPNWRVYAARSATLRDLWARPAPGVEEISRRALGPRYPAAEFGQGSEAEMWLQIQILTLRLWWTNRHSETDESNHPILTPRG